MKNRLQEIRKLKDLEADITTSFPEEDKNIFEKDGKDIQAGFLLRRIREAIEAITDGRDVLEFPIDDWLMDVKLLKKVYKHKGLMNLDHPEPYPEEVPEFTPEQLEFLRSFRDVATKLRHMSHEQILERWELIQNLRRKNENGWWVIK